MTDRNTFIFIGHGWSTGSTFNISKHKNLRIIMLRYPVCLMDDPSTRHLKSLMRIGINGYTADDYVYEMIENARKNRNEFCMYDSSEYTVVPNLLLTVHKKGNELARFQKAGDIRPTKLGAHVLMLDELVKKLGDNSTLVVYACRSELDAWQMEHLEVFGLEGAQDIENVVLDRRAKPGAATPPCRNI